jgi:hypothetical protein
MLASSKSPSRFAALMAASPETLGSMMLEADPHAWRLDGIARCAAVRDALADGAATANALRTRFPDFSPEAIAQEHGVPIAITDEEPMIGSLWRFAEYQQCPARILLYRRGLMPLRRAVTGEMASRLIGHAKLSAVFVAHELFHHAEATRRDTPNARRFQPTLFRIGRWRWRTGIPALTEIAAGAFAQSLLDLPCHPKMLDFVALDELSGD